MSLEGIKSVFSRIKNMISYKLYKATTDPDAERFVEEQKANRAKIEAYETNIPPITDGSGNTDISGTILSPPPQSLITEIIKNIVFSFFVFLFILFAIYSGHLAANDAVMRDPPYVILYFIYGAIFAPFVVLYYFIQMLRGNTVKSYAIIPIRQGTVSEGTVEGFFMSFISYIPDAEAINKRAKYMEALAKAAGTGMTSATSAMV
jgi:hypothetical protein